MRLLTASHYSQKWRALRPLATRLDVHFPPQTLHVLFKILFLQTNAFIVVSDILLMIFTNNLEYFLVRKVSFSHRHRGLCAILDLFDEFSFLSSSWKKPLNI